MELLGGRYARERVVGRGGMGSVWVGTDEVLGRPVALKELGHDAAGAAEREARLAATVSHPNVVPVFDLLIDQGTPWLVMEYVDGPTLAQLVVAEGPLSPDEAAVLLRQVSDGLQAAHDAGVVHRDVKPSNVLLAAGDRAMLTDFGVARTHDATVTNGVLTASPAYLAPEVAAGRAATPASDVWSLGATLFHMLTGAPPYEAVDGNVLGVLYRIVEQDPPRTERAGWLAPLLAGTMTKDPDARWTLSQVRAFLSGDQATRRLPSPAPGTAYRARRRWPIAVAGAAVVSVLVIVLAIMLTRGGGGSPGADVQASKGSATSPRPGDTASGSSSDAPSGAAASPTADGVTSFVQSYLSTASADPDRAFTMLTPQFQRQSGGLAGYRRFWASVTRIHGLGSITPTMDPLGVSYRYTYTQRGAGTRTEDVHLRLVFQNGHYLISGD